MLRYNTADGQNPALPIIRNIYHSSHSLGSLGSCRILSINRMLGVCRALCFDLSPAVALDTRFQAKGPTCTQTRTAVQYTLQAVSPSE